MIGAEQGIAESLYGLAVIYGDGLGVDKNIEHVGCGWKKV